MYGAGNLMWDVRVLTRKNCPVTLCSGRWPSPGGLNRGSRQVPVQVGGSIGSGGALKCVSLYVTSVRFAVLLPSLLGSQRVFLHILLPLKNARLSSDAPAVSTLACCCS